MFAWNSKKLEEEIKEKDDQIQSLQVSIRELNIESKEQFKQQAKALNNTNKKLETTELELEKAHKELEALNKKLQEMVSSDEIVTEAYNKRYFYDVVEPIISLSKREKQHLSIISISIDKIDRVLNIHGEEAYNAIVQKVVQSISHKIRESDVLVKFDEDTFIILLPNTSLEQSKIMSEKLLKVIEKLHTGHDLDLTISIGAAQHNIGKENINMTLERSITALCKAKDSGGNQVCELSN